MNRAQRIVLVIAAALALAAVASGVNLLLLDRVDGGWFDYAPNTGVIASDIYYKAASDGSIIQQGLVWVAAIGAWTALSLWLLRTPTTDGP